MGWRDHHQSIIDPETGEIKIPKIINSDISYQLHFGWEPPAEAPLPQSCDCRIHIPNEIQRRYQ